MIQSYVSKFLWTQAWRNLWRAPRRTFILLVSIAGAASSLIVFRSFVDGVQWRFRQNIFTSGIGHYQIFKKGYRSNKADTPYDYPITDVADLRSSIEKDVGRLLLFSSRQEFFGLLSRGERSIGAKGIGIQPEAEKAFLTLNHAATGSDLVGKSPTSVFLGIGLAKQLRAVSGDSVTLLVSTAGGSLNAADLQVTGTFQTGIAEIDDNLFYVPLPTVLKLLKLSGPSQILLAFSGDDENRFRDPLRRLFERR